MLNCLTVKGVLSAWQKRGPGLLPRRLQYRSMNFTGQNGVDSSPGIKMSKGRLLVLCLTTERGQKFLNKESLCGVMQTFHLVDVTDGR